MCFSTAMGFQMCEKSVFVTHDGEFNAGQKLKSDWVSENGATTSTQCLSICPRDYDKLINHWVWGSNLRTNGTRRFYSKSHFTQMYPQSITHISPYLVFVPLLIPGFVVLSRINQQLSRNPTSGTSTEFCTSPEILH